MVVQHSQVPREEDRQVAEAARAWALKLREPDVSVEDFAQWQQWLATSQAHQAAYQKADALVALVESADLSDLWPDEQELASDTYAGEVPVSQCGPESHGGARVFDGWVRPVVAAAAGALVLALFVVSGVVDDARRLLAPAEIEVVTNRTEHRQVNLRDGSTIDIGSASAVKVDFSGHQRRIDLQAGEAYFKVASDKTRPFIVSTALGDIVAVGTQFNVRLAGDHAVVTVTEGKVNVLPNANVSLGDVPESVGVAAGRAAVLSQSRREVALATQEAPPVSWREGRLAYRAEPMKYVVADLNRYASGQVLIADPEIGEMRFSGTLVPDAINEWVEALPDVFPVTVQRQADGAYVISHN